MALITPVSRPNTLSFTPISDTFIDFKSTSNSHILCDSKQNQDYLFENDESNQAKNLNDVTVDPILKSQLYTYNKKRLLFNQLRQIIQFFTHSGLKNLCEESQIKIKYLYNLLHKQKKVCHKKKIVFVFMPQLSDSRVFMDAKFKLLQLFSYLLLKVPRSKWFQLLNSKFKNVSNANKICICNKLYTVEDFSCFKCYSDPKILCNSLQTYNVYEMMYLFFKINNPSPERVLNSSFTCHMFSKRFDSGDIIKFSHFRDLISLNCITGTDLLQFCAVVVLSFKKITNTSHENPFFVNETNENLADINTYEALVPGLYFYFTDIMKLSKECMYIFYVLIQKFHENKRIRSFVKNIAKFFNIPEVYFSHIDQYDSSKSSLLITDNSSSRQKFSFLRYNIQRKHLANACRKHKESSFQVSTGKEEVDLIDRVKFLSFETETDMFEYTLAEKQFLSSFRWNRRDNLRKKSKGRRIVPTKTRDITKIKGWRNKLFATDVPKNYSVKCKLEETHISETNFKPQNVCIAIENDGKDFIKHNVDPEDFVIRNRLFIQEFNDLIPDIWSLCFDQEFSPFLKEINDIYFDLLNNDDFLKRVQNTLNQQNESEGVFHCSLTDEYLEKYSNMETSFEIPKLKTMTFSKFDDADEECKENILPDKTDIIMYFGETNNGIPNNEIDIDKFELAVPGEYSQSDIIDIPLTDSKGQHEVNLKIKSEHTSPKKTILTKAINEEIESCTHRRQFSLLNDCKFDETEDLVSNTYNFTNIQRFPLTVSCSAVNNDHSCCFNVNKGVIRLGMIINVGEKRPFNKEVFTNLEILKKDPVIIDDCWANIAASAVQQNHGRKTVKRILVPVVSKSLIDLAKFSVENLSKKIDAETEVTDVVNNLVDYVVRKEIFDGFDYPYDPDVQLTTKSEISRSPIKKIKKSKVARELGRLINVTLLDESSENIINNNEVNDCRKEYCSKGCICHSLNRTASEPHCGKAACMFECSCNFKKTVSRSEVNSQRGTNKNVLAKEESLWHQTVICKSNDVIIQGETGKSKREKKLPTRFRTNVLLGKEMNCIDLSPHSISNWRNFKQPINVPKQVSKDTTKVSQIKGEAKTPKFVIKKGDTNNVSPNSLLTSCQSSVFNSNSFDNVSKPCKAQSPISDSPPNNFMKSSKLPVSNSNSLINHLKICKPPASNSVKIPSNSIKNPQTNLSSGLSMKSLNSVKQLLKDVVYINKDPNDDSNKLDKDLLPPDWDEEGLLEMEEVDVSVEDMWDIDRDDHPLNYAFIWCDIHSDYNCQCFSHIFFTKNNVLCRNKKQSHHITLVEISKALSNTFNFSLVHLFNRNNDCARTHGSSVNYVLRNKSSGFKYKRKLEKEHNIMSNTNSLVKLDLKRFRSAKSVIMENESNTNIVVSNDEFNSAESEVNVCKSAEINKSSDSVNMKVDITEVNKALAGIISNIKKENIPSVDESSSKSKKKYRIGPAHFESCGQYRPIIARKSKRPKNTTKIIFSDSDGISDPKPASVVKAEPRYTEVDSFESSESEAKEPEVGLMCLTVGIGYLPVNCFTTKKVSVRDPLVHSIYHSFKDLDEANDWLNRFFKCKMLFEDLRMNLKWVIIKDSMLQKVELFDKDILLGRHPKVLTKFGVLMDKMEFAEYCTKNLKKEGCNGRTNGRSIAEAIEKDNKMKRMLKDELADETNAIPNKKMKINIFGKRDTDGSTILSPVVTQHPETSTCKFDFENSKKKQAIILKRLNKGSHSLIRFPSSAIKSGESISHKITSDRSKFQVPEPPSRRATIGVLSLLQDNGASKSLEIPLLIDDAVSASKSVEASPVPKDAALSLPKESSSINKKSTMVEVHKS